jgi:ribonuclease Z
MGKKSKKKRQICHTQADGSRAMDSRPAALDILSTWSADSGPSLLFTADTERLVINIPEGWQRLCVEQKIKIGKVDAVCLTHLGPSAVGGLPGYQLTAYDAGLRKTTLRGPEGLRGYAASTRHFIGRDDLEVDVEEVSNDEERGNGLLRVRAIVVEDEDVPSEPVAKKPKTVSARSVSYVIKTPDVLGRFDVAKAKALNVPPGPLYGALKRGEAVTLDDGSVVQASQVVGATTQGACVLALFVATPGALQRLRSKLQAFLAGSASLDCVVHLAPPQIAASEAYLAFARSFPSSIQQLWTQAGASPFRTAARDARLLARVAPDCYTSSTDGAEAPTDAWRGPGVQVETTGRFTLVPRSQAGYVAPELVEDDLEAEWNEVKARGLDAALEDVETAKKKEVPPSLQHAAASLCFLGTGSAMPSKHRNVSGIYLRCAAETTSVDDPGRGLLLDCGEGTLGQLRRAFGNRADECLRNLGAVWISHPHADHHLGLPSLLAERKRLAPDEPSPVLMAPWPVLRWLGDYAAVYAPLMDAYVPVECQWMKEDAPHPQQQRLNDDLRLAQCFCVPVPHCAQAYGVVVKAVDGWSLCYSGDCRPSSKLAAAARDCTVLIHEATFSDGLEDDAIKKRHSTISEALGVGRDANACRTVLTHFSQRYPALPEGLGDTGAVVASDFLRLSFPQLAWAPSLVPALRCLYGDDDDEEAAGVLF